MTAREMDAFAQSVAKHVVDSITPMVKKQVVKLVHGENLDEKPKMCTVREAARILGVGEDHMRRIKNRYPHVKSGEKQQGRILFDREALLASYGL